MVSYLAKFQAMSATIRTILRRRPLQAFYYEFYHSTQNSYSKEHL